MERGVEREREKEINMEVDDSHEGEECVRRVCLAREDRNRLPRAKYSADLRASETEREDSRALLGKISEASRAPTSTSSRNLTSVIQMTHFKRVHYSRTLDVRCIYRCRLPKVYLEFLSDRVCTSVTCGNADSNGFY